MKWKWFAIIVVLMIVITQNIEERANPITLFNILLERGIMAWIELIVITAAIVLPSFFITKTFERFTTNIYPRLAAWKSLFIAVCSTLVFYFIVMAILEPIKHV
jgi:hypothetical protein